ncbi:hypothetical protein SORBI_3006G144400 [Sorghum bicolor]|uniref:Uncharacterized protein n=1 Tax=Sorghum bicolor TaxID=4558 RepID=A0A1Z5RDW9_SORBI|nr:hypothetical protein SORBI_3006G144400 [Sorghum bicolor]
MRTPVAAPPAASRCEPVSHAHAGGRAPRRNAPRREPAGRAHAGGRAPGREPPVPDALPALVDLSPEYLIGAPDSVRERVALRGLEKHGTFADAAEGAAAVAPPPSKILRVDAVRSCEDLLVELTEQKPTLPESSLELLREVDPEIQSMAASSSVEQNGIKKHDNHQSLCNVHHLNSNIDTPRPTIASIELQPGNLTNLVNNLEKGNFKQCPVESTVDLDKPLETDRRTW